MLHFCNYAWDSCFNLTLVFHQLDSQISIAFLSLIMPTTIAALRGRWVAFTDWHDLCDQCYCGMPNRDIVRYWNRLVHDTSIEKRFRDADWIVELRLEVWTEMPFDIAAQQQFGCRE